MVCGGVQLRARARDLTRVGVDGDAGGQFGRDGEVVIVLGVGVDLAHLHRPRDHDGVRVRQVRNLQVQRVRRQIKRAQLPRARAGDARADVLEAVLVVGLVVRQPDLLVLALQRPRHARHLSNRRPLLRVGVTRLHVELTRLLRVLRVVQIHDNGGDPLATIAVEGDHQVVGAAPPSRKSRSR